MRDCTSSRSGRVVWCPNTVVCYKVVTIVRSNSRWQPYCETWIKEACDKWKSEGVYLKRESNAVHHE